jgi:hypothetical protein
VDWMECSTGILIDGISDLSKSWAFWVGLVVKTGDFDVGIVKFGTALCSGAFS